MLDFISSRATLFFVSVTLAVLAVACDRDKQAQTSSEIHTTASSLSNRTESPDSAGVMQVNPVPQSLTPDQTQQNTQPSLFELGLDKASGAFNISQTAQSIADWDLVASQYEDAIALLKQIERGNPYYAIAQSKITEYQRQAKVAQLKTIPNSQSTIVPAPVEPRQPIVAAVPEPIDSPTLVVPTQSLRAKIKPRIQQQTQPSPTISPAETEFLTQQLIQQPDKAFIIPIKRRAGGTPVIDVTFNGNQQFEMIVDTGASGTVITQQMATALAVVPVGKARANTASSKAVEFPIGYVNSMEVEGVKINKIAVAIAGAELETGLLGHDFFGDYDITIKRDVVEFRPHTDTPTNSPDIRPSIPIYPKQRQRG
jgi:predicted aspartyl protease